MANIASKGNSTPRSKKVSKLEEIDWHIRLSKRGPKSPRDGWVTVTEDENIEEQWREEIFAKNREEESKRWGTQI